MNLNLESLILLLIVAGVCGAVGRSIVGYSHGGCLTSIALGFIGAFIGRWIAGKLDLPEIFAVEVGHTRFPIVWAVVGAALFVAVLSMLTGRRRG